MKKIILITIGLVWGTSLFAQEKDTTKIKMGDTKIVIIEKKKEKEAKLRKLEQGLIEFEQILKEKTKELKKHELVLDSLNKELAKKSHDDLRKREEVLIRQEEKKVDDIEKEINALESGVDDIEDQVDELENDEFDDWNFDTEWSYDWDDFTSRKEKKFRGHWAGVEIGLNNYVNTDYSTLLKNGDELFELNPEISWAFSVNFMEFNIPFTKCVGLTTGMGTTLNNYHFRNNVNIYENSNGVITAELDVVNNYSKNSLNLWYATIPLIFEVQIPVNKERSAVHIGTGVVGSVKLYSMRKAEYSDNINEYQIKKRADFQTSALKYGFTFRIGYKFISLFANYDMMPLFKSGRGPEVYPISVGLVLLNF